MKKNYKQKLKEILLISLLATLIFISCNDDENSSNSNGNTNNYPIGLATLNVQSISPEENSIVNESTQFSVTIEYKIEDFNPNFYYYLKSKIFLKSGTDVNGNEIKSMGILKNIDILSASDVTTFSFYIQDSFLNHPDIKIPYEIQFELLKIEDETSIYSNYLLAESKIYIYNIQ